MGTEPAKISGFIHLLLTSTPSALRDCRAFTGPGDTIALLNTAVLLPLDAAWGGFAENIQLVFLSSDAEAHGVGAWLTAAGFTGINGIELVRLVAAGRHCLSWK